MCIYIYIYVCVCVCVCVFVHILQLHSSCHLLSIMDEGLVAAIIAIVQNESVTAQDGGYTLHPTALCRQITKFCLALSPPTHKPENCVCVCACACACVCVCVRALHWPLGRGIEPLAALTSVFVCFAFCAFRSVVCTNPSVGPNASTIDVLSTCVTSGLAAERRNSL